MAAPPADTIDVATGAAARLARRSALLAIGSAVVAVAAAVVVVLYAFVLVALVVMVAVIYAFLFTVSWHRARAACDALRSGPYIHVRAVGWNRSTDGCLYGLFLAEGTSEPDHVLRLPMRRDMEPQIEGWVAGTFQASTNGGVALFDDEELRATGRILDSSDGRKRWYRRNEPTGIWGKARAMRR